MKILLFAALICGSALLSACADMRWTKAGADPAAVSRDRDECRATALTLGAPSGAAVVTPPDQPVERGAMPVGARPAATADERFIAEHEVVRLCMQRRGYQLQSAR
jgi:hypothetical protein